MRLVRFGQPGAERPGALVESGAVRDLSAWISDWTPDTVTVETIAKLRSVDLNGFPLVSKPDRLGPPLRRTGKFIAIGLNYRDHAIEANMPIPAEPIVFMKAPSCLSGPYDPIQMPRGATKVDWEVELGVVIGSVLRYAPMADAIAGIAGYTVVHDVSERAFQLERGGQWDKGKGCDSFGPIGPWLATTDEVPDPQSLQLWLDVNGVRKQTGTTSLMIFPVSEIVSYVSHFMTLEPGDIIATGTPPGVGMGFKPPQWLKPGDVVRLGITGLGEQQQTVLAP